MVETEYRVELDLFEGPLDLLLYLARRNEVDILQLPLAAVTAQFQEFYDILEFLNLEIVGDFIVTAAALVEMKSQMALPQSQDEEKEPQIEEEHRSELIKRLIEYKRFKEASDALVEQAADWQERFPRLSSDRPQQSKDHAADRIKEVELWDLVSALGRIIRKKQIERETKIKYDDVPISVYIERIGKRVVEEERVAFSSFFEGINRRVKIVSIFMAILELIRHHNYRAEQPTAYGEIWILKPLDS